MKLHKISNVDKNVCSCEQKIAYNYAFMHRRILEAIYYSDSAESIKNEDYYDVIQQVVDSIKRKGIDKKYNMDAIIHCFRNGIKNYVVGCDVLGSYEEIGKIFPCLYDIN